MQEYLKFILSNTNYLFFIIISPFIAYFIFNKKLTHSKFSFRKINKQLKLSTNPYQTKIEIQSNEHTIIHYTYKGKPIIFNLTYKKEDSTSNIKFNFKLNFTDAKPITKTNLFHTTPYSRFLNCIIKSTTQIRGDEGRIFRLIVEHQTGADFTAIRQTSEELFSEKTLNLIKESKIIEKIEVTPNQLTLTTRKFPPYDHFELQTIFEIMTTINQAKITDRTHQYLPKLRTDPQTQAHLNLIQTILTCINNNEINETFPAYFSPNFNKQFSTLLKQRKSEINAENQKITIHLSPTPKINLKTSSNHHKLTIQDSFSTQTTPYKPEYQKQPEEISTWTLNLDPTNGKIFGMSETIWGLFDIPQCQTNSPKKTTNFTTHRL